MQDRDFEEISLNQKTPQEIWTKQRKKFGLNKERNLDSAVEAFNSGGSIFCDDQGAYI